jgi:hypothetical protein
VCLRRLMLKILVILASLLAIMHSRPSKKHHDNSKALAVGASNGEPSTMIQQKDIAMILLSSAKEGGRILRERIIPAGE